MDQSQMFALAQMFAFQGVVQGQTLGQPFASGSAPLHLGPAAPGGAGLAQFAFGPQQISPPGQQQQYVSPLVQQQQVQPGTGLANTGRAGSRSLGSGSSGKRSRQDSGGPSKKGRKGRGAADPAADKSAAAADLDDEGAGTRKARTNYSEAIKSSTLQVVAEYIRKHHQWPDGQQLSKIRLVVDPNKEQFTGSPARQIYLLIRQQMQLMLIVLILVIA